jgi:hypothetical protein
MELEEPAQGVFAVMSCIEEFLNVPVMIQLKAPIVAAVSDRPVTLESGVSCGYAIMAPGAKKEQDGTFPILLQILCGSIDLADEKNVILTTVGADNKTAVRVLLERENILNITFCVEHNDWRTPAPSQIVLPS